MPHNTGKLTRSEQAMEDDYESRDQPPSKSQLKRDAHALQQLGVALLDISEDHWAKLRLPDNLVVALRDAKHMPSHGARKRQIQLIGKLMRGVDPEPIRQHFEQLRLNARRQARQQHELEEWRDRIITDGDSAIDAYLAEHPAADRQHLRQLVRQAIKERDAKRPPKSSRALFRYLRDIGPAPGGPETP
jgi:ribosome-associated protein